METRPEIFIVAGDPSGDMIGSLLVAQLLRLRPDLRVTAIGGDQMARAGAEVRLNIVRDLAIIGLAEVVTKFPRLTRLFRRTVQELRERRPRTLVLIDYPGFNLRLARQARRLGLKVLYYVVPQVWAWHRGRVSRLRRDVDRALVILPFEEKFLRDAGVQAEYVGHPLLDIMILTMSRQEVFEKFKLDPEKRLIGLLPGSRRREVDAMLPIMLEAAQKIQAQDPRVQFVLPRAATIRGEQIDRHLAASSVEVKVVDSFRYNVRGAMDFALVTSGTATLETGLLLCPMVILYRVAYPTWLLAKLLVQVPYIGLINIVSGDMVAPELLQDQCTGGNVADRALRIMGDPDEMRRIRHQLERVKERLGGPGASRRAAQATLELAGLSPAAESLAS